MTPLVIVASGLLGLMLGSFSNAAAWRLREQEKLVGKKHKNSRRAEKLSITKGRSMCVHCGHQLSSTDLIPVMSWVFLRGKCRYCKKRISKQYPIVEVISAVVFALSTFFWPFSADNHWSLIILALFFVVLTYYIILCIYDIKWTLLPNKLTYGVALFSLIISILIAFFIRDTSFHIWVKDIVLSLIISSGLFWLLFVFSGGSWIGGGDVKIGLSIGLLLSSFEKSFMMLFVASLLGTIFSVPILIRKGSNARKATIPFGPFLMLSCWVVFLFGMAVIDWYKTKILP